MVEFALLNWSCDYTPEILRCAQDDMTESWHGAQDDMTESWHGAQDDMTENWHGAQDDMGRAKDDMADSNWSGDYALIYCTS